MNNTDFEAVSKNILDKIARFYRDESWPKRPLPTSELNDAVDDLMESKTWIAGCFNQILVNQDLPEHLHRILTVDEELTERIKASQDPRRYEFLVFKLSMDECIRLSNLFLELKAQKESAS